MTREEILLVAKPILFNTDMVKAILDGRKTATRRLIKPPYFIDGDESNPKSILTLRTAPKGSKIYRQIGKMPYPDKPYKISDYLYVRETWHVEQIYGNVGTYGFDCVYKADEKIVPVITKDIEKYCSWSKFFDRDCWLPSIHMPKEAARIFLRVTDVRVERLQGMSHDDALKEGIHYLECPDGFSWKSESDMHCCYISSIGAMVALWNSTISKKDMDKYGWHVNPWVWVIEFERVIPEQWEY